MCAWGVGMASPECGGRVGMGCSNHFQPAPMRRGQTHSAHTLAPECAKLGMKTTNHHRHHAGSCCKECTRSSSSPHPYVVRMSWAGFRPYRTHTHTVGTPAGLSSIFGSAAHKRRHLFSDRQSFAAARQWLLALLHERLQDRPGNNEGGRQ